jgi:hypothetical protein
MKSKKLWVTWRKGMGILLRLFYLSFMMGLVTLPLKILTLDSFADSKVATVIAIVYFLTIVPLALPRMFRKCGLASRHTGSFDNGGTMNEAAKQKQVSLSRS